MLDPHFAILGASIGTIGGLSYLFDTLKGKIQPNKVTWFIWAASLSIAFAAQFKQNVGWPALMTFAAALVTTSIFISSFVNKKAGWQIGKLDIVCGSLALAGLILWQVTQVGNIAIFFSILSDGFGAIPTIVKSYKLPKTENYWVYLLYAINAAITLLIIKNWNFASAAFAIYYFSLCASIFLLVKFKLGAKIQKQFT